jgi:hypothetical protein
MNFLCHLSLEEFCQFYVVPYGISIMQYIRLIKNAYLILIYKKMHYNGDNCNVLKIEFEK